MSFLPFDPDLGVSSYHRNLPHWRQGGVTYFVTFRLADSLPASVLRELEGEKRLWLQAHGLDSVEQLAGQPEALRWEYAKTFNSKWQDEMDACHGASWLRRYDLRKFIVESLIHWHGTRWDLDLAVVMPNHVHALVSPAPDWPLAGLLHSVKRHSARAINAALGRKGQLWQDESFDHIVRSVSQLEHFREYIRKNPKKARLKEGEFWIGGGTDAAQ